MGEVGVVRFIMLSRYSLQEMIVYYMSAILYVAITKDDVPNATVIFDDSCFIVNTVVMLQPEFFVLIPRRRAKISLLNGTRTNSRAIGIALW